MGGTEIVYEAEQVSRSRRVDRLRRMIELRLDYRLHPRLDASDVVQDALLAERDRHCARAQA
jgi:hypothetical protein